MGKRNPSPEEIKAMSDAQKAEAEARDDNGCILNFILQILWFAIAGTALIFVIIYGATVIVPAVGAAAMLVVFGGAVAWFLSALFNLTGANDDDD